MPLQKLDDSIQLRLHSSDDLPFMLELYKSTRESELNATNFTAEEKHDFLQQQFFAQYNHYSQHYCSDEFNIIECNKAPIGRFFVDHWENEIRVVDIALMPQYRNRGIGTYLLTRLFQTARETNRCVTIHVEHNNPAKKLYERLGFSLKSKTNDIYLLMSWSPSANP